MIAITVCLALGAVIGIIGLIAFLLVLDRIDGKRARAQAQVDQEHRAAERQLQAITQSAMREMLAIARRYQ